MKKQILILSILSISLWNCNHAKKENITTKTTTSNNPYLGEWTRSFQMSEESTATVNYIFYNDSIQYEMKGPMNLNYSIKKDTFLVKGNRWIGKKGTDTYVIFIQPNSKEKITLLKMKSKDIATALKMPFPSDTARSKFSSWNIFNKKQ